MLFRDASLEIDSPSDRRIQWANYFGELKSVYYGEFNVVVMTLSAFRAKNMLDMSYLREISVSLVIGDDIFKYSKLVCLWLEVAEALFWEQILLHGSYATCLVELWKWSKHWSIFEISF